MCLFSNGYKIIAMDDKEKKLMSEQQPYRTPAPPATTSTADTAQQMAPGTTAKAQEVGDRIQHEAQRLTEQAKEQGQAMFQDQKYVMAEQVSGLASALHNTDEHLKTQDQRAMAQYTQQAAEGLQRFSQTLKDRELGSLMGQVEDFARHQPGAFIGSAALLGFMAARFLKSSAERSSHASQDTPSPSSYRRAQPAPTSPAQTTMPQTVDRPDTPRPTSSPATTPTAMPPKGDH
jgi:hypothetical protein